MFFIQSFDFTFQGIIYCGILFPVLVKWAFCWQFYYRHKELCSHQLHYQFILSWWANHFHFTKFSARELSGSRGLLWIFCIFLVLYNFQTWFTIGHSHIMNNCVWKDNIMYNLTILKTSIKHSKRFSSQFIFYYNFFHS